MDEAPAVREPRHGSQACTPFVLGKFPALGAEGNSAIGVQGPAEFGHESRLAP